MAQNDSDTGVDDLLDGTAAPPRGRRRAVVALGVAVALLSALVLTTAGVLWGLTQWVTTSVRSVAVPALHDPAPQGTPSDTTPRQAADLPMTVLLIGSDLRAGADVGGGVTGQRADSIMLVRFDTDGAVTVLSIPRDSWVPIPGVGTEKINASLAGSPSLVVRTVEDLTGVPIDHVVLVDFNGVRDLTTALGGVTVDNPTASTDPLTHTHFDAGPITLSGDRALTFVRERYGLPGGDFGRIDHQQELVSAIGRQLAAADLLAHPALLRQTVGIVARDVTVDSGLTPQLMTQLGVAVLTAPPGAVRFYTAPWSGFGTSADGESYVRLDMPLLGAACRALRDGAPVPLPETPIAGR